MIFNNYIYIYTLFLKYFYGLMVRKNSLYILTKYNYLLYILNFFKNNSIIKINYLSDITVVDNINNTNYRFELLYVFWNLKYYIRFYFKIFVNGIFPIISINTLFPNSNWLEREIWDMFGLKFIFNNDLRRILTDYGFKGHPLRKDFPLLGFIELRYSNLKQSICVKPTKVMQNLRFFKYNNPWINLI